MTDIFQEVEEDVRRERYAQLWKQYGDYVVAAAALVILAGAGFQVWRYYEKKAEQRASAQYNAAQALFDTNHPDQAAIAFGRIADSAPGGYALLARLHHADALQASGQDEQALKLYKAIAAGDDPLLSSVARLREGWMMAEGTPRLELETLLAPLTDPKSPWRFLAREILAYSDYRAGRLEAARKEFETLAAETEAPIGVRQRATALAGFLKAGGDRPFGTVPEPQAKAAPEAAKPAGEKPSSAAKAEAKPVKHKEAHRGPAHPAASHHPAAHGKPGHKHK